MFTSFPAPSSCGSPNKLLNTTIQGNDYRVGAVIQYKCPIGHMLVGDTNRTCGKEGFWSGIAPSCKCEYFLEYSLIYTSKLEQAIRNWQWSITINKMTLNCNFCYITHYSIKKSAWYIKISPEYFSFSLSR